MAARLALLRHGRQAMSLNARCATRPAVYRMAVMRHYSEPAEAPAAAGKTYSPKIEGLVDEISSMTIIEVADLVEALKTRLNIADMPMAVAPVAGGAPAAAEEEVKEEQTEFDVKLTKFGEGTKIKVIKEVRNVLPDLKLAEAKKLVEGAPTVLKKGISKEDAQKIKEALEAVGGSVEIE